MKIINYISIFGIDVAIGAAASYLFVAKIHSTSPDIAELVIIILTVMFLYNLDHYLDTKKLISPDLNSRRGLQLRFQREILTVSIISGISSIILALLLLEHLIIIMGIALAGLILIYFAFIHRRNYRMPKEIIAATGYTIGVWLPFLHLINLSIFLIFMILLIINIQNLISYSIVDFDEDRSHEFSSFFNHNLAFLNRFSRANSLLFLLLSILLIFIRSDIILAIIFAIIFIIQLIMPRLIEKFSLNSRLLGEFSYLILLLTYFT